MFGTIRRHQSWLWAIIVTITVASFVIFFSPNSKFSRDGGGGKVSLGTVAGDPVSLQDFRQAQSEMFIHYFLSHGDWPDKDASAKQLGFDIERETYFRLFFIHKFKEYNIHVSQEAIGEQAAQILRSIGRGGSPVTVEQFSQQVLQPRGFTITDFRRFLEHQIALRDLISIVGMSGRLVSSEEALALFQLEHQQISSEVVFFSVSNYLSAVSITADAVGQYYTNQMSRYRLPERVQVSYVKFNLTNFLAEANVQIAKLTNFDQTVEAIYLQRGTNYYSEAKTPAEAKAKIKDEVRRDFALRAARNKAAQFSEELMGHSPAQTSFLDELAAKQGLSVNMTAPFSVQRGPVELEVPANFPKVAFKLTSEEPFGGPIVAEDGVYIIALKKRLPSEIPSLDSIHDQVQADYQYIQAAQLARAAGTNFSQKLVTGLSQGKNFAALCAESKLTPVKIPAFSLSTRSLPEIENRISLGRLQEIAFGIPVGQTSGFVSTEDGGGVILQVIARSAGDSNKIKADFPAFLAQIRQTRQGEAFNAWFGREADRALRDTPIARAKQP